MAKYKVTTDQGSYVVTTDDSASPPQTATGGPAPAPGMGERMRAGAESFLKTPALPIIAGVGAGLATSAASPLVSAPAAALAGSAGEAARQIGLRAVSSKQQGFLDQDNPDLPQTPGDAAKLIAERGIEQGAAELGGRAIGAVAKPVLNVIGRGAAAGMKGLTKIPAAAFERIFANPSELLTAPLKSTINKAYGEVGFLAEGTLEQAAKEATTSNAAFIRAGMKELDKPFTEVAPKRLFDARKAVDAEIDQLQFAGGPKAARSIIKNKLAKLTQVREGMNMALDILAEGGNKDVQALRAADQLATKGAEANSFRSLVPRVNVMQSLPRAATAPLVIPAVAGGATALAGAAAKTVPYLGRAGLGGLSTGVDMGSALIDALRKKKR